MNKWQEALRQYLETGHVQPGTWAEACRESSLQPMTRKQGAMIGVDKDGRTRAAFVPAPPSGYRKRA